MTDSVTDSVTNHLKSLSCYSKLLTCQGTRVLSEPHTLLDALYLHNRNMLDEESYANLVMNIIKIHLACVDSEDSLDCVVIKPMFKCTPQLTIIRER